MTAFKRQQSPFKSLDIGIHKLIKDWFNSNDTAGASFDPNLKDSVIIVDVQGDAVLDNFDIVDSDLIKEFKGIKWGNIINGHVTVLSELSPEELYRKIRDFYLKILDKCLGKTIEEQEKILFPNQRGSILRMKPDLIESSEKYIQSLPDNPTNKQLLDLVNQIRSGCLEYGYHAKDEYSVKMHQYAETLEKKIK